MLSLSAVVAIAASGAAIFIVFSVVGIVVWVRVRKERHALRLLGLNQEGGRGLPTFNGNTLTTLSNEEGRALRAHGQLPYGKPAEWGQLTSRESLLRKNEPDSSFPLVIEKARSLRHSISRSRSKRLSRFSKHSRLSSMATVSETNQEASPSRSSKEEIPLSAVEGVLELPAERTPRQTPEIKQEDTGFHVGLRPVSPAWPLPTQRERSGLFPVLEDRNSQEMFDPPPRVFDESPKRVRGSSICSQSAGVAPDEPVPPPPPAAAFPTDRFSYARNDSVMRLSSMSLDTTNSSILDDGRNGPRSADTELTSPTFASGGTFVPYSASDVGVKNGRRSFIAANTNTALPPMHNFPVRSSSTAEGRRRSSVDYMSPRRSMTTASRAPSNGSDRFGGPPRRSESLSSNPPSRHASLRSGTPIGMSGFQNMNSINWRSSNSQMAYVPHFNQYQQPPVYENQQQNDPFYGNSPVSTGTLFSNGSPGQTTGSSMPPSPMQRSSLSLRGAPLTPALKSSSSHRKGHRRQNCVRISIHPPITFGGPNFTPTVEEEPEDTDQMEEVDLRESAVNGKALPVLPVNTTSPLPLSKRGSRRNKAQHSALGPLAEEPQSHANRSPSKKRKHAPGDSAHSNPQFCKDRGLPELLTSLPPTLEATSLSDTPSPERIPPVWEVPEVPSPTYENSPGTGSPRRSAVKGPRSQPASAPRPVRSSSTRAPEKPPVDPFVTAGSPADVSQITGTQGSDWRKSTDSLHRTATDATEWNYRRSRNSRDSFAGGLGSAVLSSPAHGTKGSAKQGSTVRDRVTIWEDANRSGSPPKPQLAGSYRFGESNTSPTHDKNSVPRSLSKTDSPSRQQVPPTPTSARRGMTTPTGKGLGIGIGCATPVSLYDGDGFLRE